MPDGLPLSDVNVLDFTWVVAAPGASRVMADYGATVVRVETTKRIDTARTFGPFHTGKPGPENSILFQSMNAGKRGVTLDLSKPEGRAVALDLVRWADVVTEAFSPGVIRSFGLDYESLRKVKPDLIMLSTCIFGQSGPLSGFAGYGSLAAAISGFYFMTGWPDRPPAGPYNAYTDTVVPRFVLIAILAALDHRRRTGQGSYIDQSHVETALHFLAPALLDYSVNGRGPVRAGNRHPQIAPHGVYPAAGGDRWVAIVAETEEQWRALCDALGRPELANDERFATVEARLQHQDELDAMIAAWTAQRDPHEAETLLQARGVPSSAVQRGADLWADPQLHHRGHFASVPHPTLGEILVEGTRVKLSRTPARLGRAGPTMGQDNQYVLEQLLGYKEEQIAELVAAGALE
jgi:crotonobetainyl-CoA:carnitine CoA-transferase CaiB-like acyl-CoA transferase